MKESDKALLKNNGWTVECESPLEISDGCGSFASNAAAELVVEALRLLEERLKTKQE